MAAAVEYDGRVLGSASALLLVVTWLGHNQSICSKHGPLRRVASCRRDTSPVLMAQVHELRELSCFACFLILPCICLKHRTSSAFIAFFSLALQMTPQLSKWTRGNFLLGISTTVPKQTPTSTCPGLGPSFIFVELRDSSMHSMLRFFYPPHPLIMPKYLYYAWCPERKFSANSLFALCLSLIHI